MNLKDTLNLPKTAFPMRADLVNREPIRAKKWKENRVYEKIQRKNINGDVFILHDGPPFTNGYVHIGTALNKILKDIIVRYKTMRGFRTPYVPGWDCHGLPIEHKVVKELREKNIAFDAVSLRKECENYSKKFITIQQSQFERLGILADWENAYRTMDPTYESHVINFFADCVAQGLIYRSKKPVYWSIPCKTALAEAEIEYRDHVSQSIWVKFKFSEGSVVTLGVKSPCYAIIWTTTPWTIPSNMAIAVHPNLSYVILWNGVESYLICEDRVSQFVNKCRVKNYEVLSKIKGADLKGLITDHPMVNRQSRIVMAQYVTTDSGTGCVHIAPGHGLEDYNTGLENNLKIYCPIDDDGQYENDGQIPKELVGVSVLEDSGNCAANDKVIEILSRNGALLSESQYSHQYPHCWRSKTPVIFRAMTQWFISLDKNGLREKMQNAVGTVNWVPSWGENRIRGAIASRNDWCISRQRAWGIPLPAFYDNQGNPLLNERVIREIAKKIEKFGSNFWFESTEDKLLDGIDLPSDWPKNGIRKGTDSLDVWIDSGNSHQAVLKNDKNLSWPADIYLEGSDQHRGWFQSSMWISVISQGGLAPFKNVLTHGFIVGEDKKKISKSDGKPQTADDYVNKFGVDVLRLWISSEDFRSDITISDDIINHVSATYRTLRNTLRFQIGNLYDFDHTKNKVEWSKVTLIDKWMLQKTKKLVEDVTSAYDFYEIHRVYQLLNRFCSVELSATYHDILKDRLYTFPANSLERRASQTTIYSILNTLIVLLSPITTFTCDEAMAYLKTNTDFCEDFIQMQNWISADSFPDFSSEEKDFDTLLSVRSKVNDQMEKSRQEKLIGQSLDAKVIIEISKDHVILPTLDKYHEILSEVFIVSQVEIKTIIDPGICVIRIVPADGEKCPRSWKWVSKLVDAGQFGKVSPKSFEALAEKYSDLVK